MHWYGDIGAVYAIVSSLNRRYERATFYRFLLDLLFWPIMLAIDFAKLILYIKLKYKIQ